MKRCKCKNPKPKRIGNCEICKKCGKLIYKIRKIFYKRTKIKESKKKYNRNKTKKQTRKEIQNA
jgi:hypothetical protein